MYEDENNLYHYSYRKGDEQNPNAPIDTKNYAEDPWDKSPNGGSPKKKGGNGLSGKVIALALVCALVGGFVGAGVSSACRSAHSRRWATAALPFPASTSSTGCCRV